MIVTKFRTALYIYVLIFLGLMFKYFFFGEVISPYRQFSELAKIQPSARSQVENRKFSDFGNAYIPSIYTNLNAKKSGWITLWTNKNEIGRPVLNLSGFSSAYFPSWIISKFTSNPWRFITIISLFFCFLTGLFILFYCNEIGLAPLSGLVAGITLSASPVIMYWLSFPMFVSVWCWASGALWSIARLARKSDFTGWSILTFCGYSLLVTSYPQLVIYHIYLLGIYTLYLANKKRLSDKGDVKKFLILIFSAVFVAIFLSLPVYMDLFNTVEVSSRLSPKVGFFTAALPHINTTLDAARYFVLNTIPEIFGNLIDPNYPIHSGPPKIHFYPFYFIIIALISSFRITWGWWLAVAILSLLAFRQNLFEYGVKYFFLDLSRSNPLGNILIPLAILAAYGVESMIRHIKEEKREYAVSISVLLVVLIFIFGVEFGIKQSYIIHWDMFIYGLIAVFMAAIQIKHRKHTAILASLILYVAVFSYPLEFHQDLKNIPMTSNFVNSVKKNLPVDARIAIVSPDIKALPPNMNSIVGIASIHSYNSLSSKYYHYFIDKLGGNVKTYGRLNSYILPNYNSSMFWMANIGLVLAKSKLKNNNLEFIGENSGIRIYKVNSRMGENLQVIPNRFVVSSDGIDLGDPRMLSKLSSSKLLDKGDVLEFSVDPSARSILILDQKFHRDWQAKIFRNSSWKNSRAIIVNNVFQGVVLPKGTERVLLEFKPYSRFAWIANLFWILIILGFVYKLWFKVKGNNNELES